MATAKTILMPTQYLATAETTQYTAPSAVKAVLVDELTVANRTAGPVTLVVRVVPSGGTPGNEHELYPSKSLAAGEVYQVPPFALGPGDFVRTIAGAANSLVGRMSGRVVT